jgi:hypothetical protein
MEAITDKVFAKEPPFLPLSFILPLEETKKEVFGPAESSNNSVSNASESKVEAVNVNPSVTDCGVGRGNVFFYLLSHMYPFFSCTSYICIPFHAL